MESATEKYVTNRKGEVLPLDSNEIKKRLETLGKGLNLDFINFDVIVTKVLSGIYQSTRHPAHRLQTSPPPSSTTSPPRLAPT